MNLDPELAVAAVALAPGDLRDVGSARASNRDRHAADQAYRLRDRLHISDVRVPGGAGPRLARLFRPHDAAVRGAVLYLHGGAFALGDLDACDSICARIAHEADVVVLALDYRLAPEHPAPAALEDSVAALAWMAARAAALGLDQARLGVVGSSAGGCLAAGVALRARDSGGPEVSLLMLVQPVLDDRARTPSARLMSGSPVFDSHSNLVMWELYLAGRAADRYVAPARTTDLVGLPPTAVFVAQFDPLRDEAIDFATRLAQAGVPTEMHLYPGTFHGFDALVPSAAVSERAIAEQVAVVRRELAVSEHGVVDRLAVQQTGAHA